MRNGGPGDFCGRLADKKYHVFGMTWNSSRKKVRISSRYVMRLLSDQPQRAPTGRCAPVPRRGIRPCIATRNGQRGGLQMVRVATGRVLLRTPPYPSCQPMESNRAWSRASSGIGS